jgi:hypothetical protein
LKKVNLQKLKEDIYRSELFTASAKTVDEFADQLDTTITHKLNANRRQADLIIDGCHLLPSKPSGIDAAYIVSGGRLLVKLIVVRVVSLIKRHDDYYGRRINDATSDSHRCLSLIRDVLHQIEQTTVEYCVDCQTLADYFVANPQYLTQST